VDEDAADGREKSVHLVSAFVGHSVFFRVGDSIVRFVRRHIMPMSYPSC
jgi:hypothetical protein